MNAVRAVHALAGALALAGLVACGGTREVAPVTVEGLDTWVVQAGEGGGGRAWDGVVEAVREATLSAQTSGRVAEVLRDVNDRVAAGEVLVRLSAVEQRAAVEAARAQLRAAEASAAEAEATYRRYQELSQDHYVSRLQLDQIRTARDSALAARDAARAQVANASQLTDYTVIRAPYAGVVATRNVEPGESVGIGQRLMTVFSPDALRIEVSVPQSQADAIRARPVAQVRFDDGRRVDAAKAVVFPAADAATHAVTVRVVLPQTDPAPEPGRTAKVVFPAVQGAALLRIPAAALMRRGEVSAVYVLKDGHLSLRQLRLGERVGERMEVIAGLEAGETIATDPVAAAQALVAARKGRN